MAKTECDISEVVSTMKKMIAGAQKMQEVDGTIVVLDSQFVDSSMESAKTILSQNDQDAIDEYEYELTKLRIAKGEIRKAIVDRYARDLIRKAFKL